MKKAPYAKKGTEAYDNRPGFNEWIKEIYGKVREPDYKQIVEAIEAAKDNAHLYQAGEMMRRYIQSSNDKDNRERLKSAFEKQSKKLVSVKKMTK